VFGGGRPQGEGYDKGNFLNATILVDVADDSRMVTEEVFGPALPVIRIKDLDEGLRRLAASLGKDEIWFEALALELP